MAATHEDLAARILQLEREVRELAVHMSNDPIDRPDLADRISLRAWLKLSAPTFTVLLVGFTLLWNAQQVSSAQLLEVSRSLGRLDGAVAGLEATTARFDRRLESFGERLAGIDQRLASFDQRLASFDQRLESFDQRLASFDQRLESFEQRMAALDGSLGRLGAAVDKLAERI